MKLRDMTNKELLELCINSNLYNQWASESDFANCSQNLAAFTLDARIKDMEARLAEAQKEAYPAYKREKALRCKAEFELSEARKENKELKTHAYVVAKDLRKRMNEQDALWQETAQHLLERAEKAEAELAELRGQNKVLREEENVPYLRELKENAELRERMKPVEEVYKWLQSDECNRWLNASAIGFILDKVVQAIKAACEEE